MKNSRNWKLKRISRKKRIELQKQRNSERESVR